jgi:hypothetical protein
MSSSLALRSAAREPSSAAARLSASCSGALAPMIGEVIVGFESTQQRPWSARSFRPAWRPHAVFRPRELALVPVVLLMSCGGRPQRERGRRSRVVLAGLQATRQGVVGNHGNLPPATAAAGHARMRETADCNAAEPTRLARCFSVRCGPMHAQSCRRANWILQHSDAVSRNTKFFPRRREREFIPYAAHQVWAYRSARVDFV